MPEPDMAVCTITANGQLRPAVDTLDNSFVVVWFGYGTGDADGIFGQIFDDDGAKIGSNNFLVNEYTTSSQDNPDITKLNNGNFVVVWQSDGQDTNKQGVYGKIYNSNGAVVRSEFQINTTTFGDQDVPAVEALTEGGFVVAWVSETQDGNGDGVYRKQYDSGGNVVKVEALVNTTTINHQNSPDVARASGGGYIIVWDSDQNDIHTDIFAKRYDSFGDPLTEFQINTTTENHQEAPRVIAFDNNTKFAIIWQSQDQDLSGKGIFGRLVWASNGAFIDDEFLVNTTAAGDQKLPSVAELNSPGQGFITTWESSDGNGLGIYAQKYDDGGYQLGGEFLINTYTTNSQESSDVAINLNSNFVAVWQSWQQDESTNYGIFGKVY
ncbi:hypothetical protein ACFL5G_04860 [Candidatus Margulisiibacteriota bacterium]